MTDSTAHRWRAAAMLVAASLATAACGGGEGSRTTLTVFAAASLTDAFDAVAAAFETAEPAYEVEFSYAASSTLREQILEGAPADVYASANPGNMDQVVESGQAVDPVPFVRNLIQIAVPSGNPAGISGVEDFAREELLIGMCAEQVPCGDFGRQVLANAGVVPSIDTNEANVRSLLTKIEAGELDAGLVYRTDVASTDLVLGIDVPGEWNVEATYPIAVLAGARQPEGAEAFVAFVLSSEGQAILAEYGFLAP